MAGVSIRAARPEDWPAMWEFMRRILGAGETFCWDRDMAEEEVRASWYHDRPGARSSPWTTKEPSSAPP